jgi:hypothetical protein
MTYFLRPPKIDATCAEPMVVISNNDTASAMALTLHASDYMTIAQRGESLIAEKSMQLREEAKRRQREQEELFRRRSSGKVVEIFGKQRTSPSDENVNSQASAEEIDPLVEEPLGNSTDLAHLENCSFFKKYRRQASTPLPQPLPPTAATEQYRLPHEVIICFACIHDFLVMMRLLYLFRW